jgi:hypothetical protein
VLAKVKAEAKVTEMRWLAVKRFGFARTLASQARPLASARIQKAEDRRQKAAGKKQKALSASLAAFFAALRLCVKFSASFYRKTAITAA